MKNTRNMSGRRIPPASPLQPVSPSFQYPRDSDSKEYLATPGAATSVFSPRSTEQNELETPCSKRSHDERLQAMSDQADIMNDKALIATMRQEKQDTINKFDKLKAEVTEYQKLISDKDNIIEFMMTEKQDMELEFDLLRVERDQLKIEQHQLIIVLYAVGFGLMAFGMLLVVLYWILGWQILQRRMVREGRPRSRRIRRLPSMPSIKEEPRGQKEYDFEIIVNPPVSFNLNRGCWPPEPFDLWMENSSAVQGSMMDDVVNEMVEDEIGDDDQSNEGFVVTE